MITTSSPPPSFNPTQDDASRAGMGNYISDFGPYVGQIVLAEHLVASTGTEGMVLRFQLKSGMQSPLLKWYLRKPDGKELSDWGHLGALKYLIGITGELQPVNGTVKRYAESAGKQVDQMGWVFPQLVGQWCGFYLKHELWDNKNSGKTERKLKIDAVYSPKTGQTYSELIKETPAAYIKQMFELEKANPVPDPALIPGNQNNQSCAPSYAQNNAAAAQHDPANAHNQQPHERPDTTATGSPAYDPEFDDDIPF